MTSPAIWMTYAEAAEHLGIKPSSVKRRAIQRKWPRQIGNDGLARIQLPDDAAPSPTPKITGDDTSANTSEKITPVGETDIMRLTTDLAAVRAEAAGLRDRLADAHANQDRLARLLEHALEQRRSWWARLIKR